MLSLPTEIDTAKVEANYEHGVLKLRLPKSEAVKPRRVQIQSGGTAKPIEAQMRENRPAESQTGDGKRQRQEELAAGSR